MVSTDLSHYKFFHEFTIEQAALLYVGIDPLSNTAQEELNSNPKCLAIKEALIQAIENGDIEVKLNRITPAFSQTKAQYNKNEIFSFNNAQQFNVKFSRQAFEKWLYSKGEKPGFINEAVDIETQPAIPESNNEIFIELYNENNQQIKKDIVSKTLTEFEKEYASTNPNGRKAMNFANEAATHQKILALLIRLYVKVSDGNAFYAVNADGKRKRIQNDNLEVQHYVLAEEITGFLKELIKKDALPRGMSVETVANL